MVYSNKGETEKYKNNTHYFILPTEANVNILIVIPVHEETVYKYDQDIIRYFL